MDVLKSISMFVLAGLCEIGGGYLVWMWLKKEYSIGYAVIGALLLIFYGVVATWQEASFGRVYAAYGAIFIVMSLLWAYVFDQFRPDKYDIIGALVVLLGACVILYAPRG